MVVLSLFEYLDFVYFEFLEFVFRLRKPDSGANGLDDSRISGIHYRQVQIFFQVYPVKGI